MKRLLFPSMLLLFCLVAVGCPSADDSQGAAESKKGNAPSNSDQSQSSQSNTTQPSVSTDVPLPEFLDTLTNNFGMKMVYLEPGTFTMGSPVDEKDRDDDEIQHSVTLTKGFYMQSTEVTQGQWKAVMETEPWKSKSNIKKSDQYPAVYISWDDAVAFCKKLSEKTGKTYRLPTEAEWEYAARAGSTTAYSFGNDKSQLSRYAWFIDSRTGLYPHRVATKLPNKWGLYDMHGNVWEWCSDWYVTYPNNAVTDPKSASTGSTRVYRSGGWNSTERNCRSANRDGLTPSFQLSNLGFRVVHELD